jgi:hypothetical protein
MVRGLTTVLSGTRPRGSTGRAPRPRRQPRQESPNCDREPISAGHSPRCAAAVAFHCDLDHGDAVIGARARNPHEIVGFVVAVRAPQEDADDVQQVVAGAGRIVVPGNRYHGRGVDGRGRTDSLEREIGKGLAKPGGGPGLAAEVRRGIGGAVGVGRLAREVRIGRGDERPRPRRGAGTTRAEPADEGDPRQAEPCHPANHSLQARHCVGTVRESPAARGNSPAQLGVVPTAKLLFFYAPQEQPRRSHGRQGYQ